MTTFYAVYRGDAFEFVGSKAEVADWLQVKPKTVSFLASPTLRKRRKNPNKALLVERVEVTDE